MFDVFMRMIIFSEQCTGVGEIKGMPGADEYCQDQCIVYGAKCPKKRCVCYWLRPNRLGFCVWFLEKKYTICSFCFNCQQNIDLVFVRSPFCVSFQFEFIQSSHYNRLYVKHVFKKKKIKKKLAKPSRTHNVYGKSVVSLIYLEIWKTNANVCINYSDPPQVVN